MEKEKLLEEYKVTLESLVEKTKFVYSSDFYSLDEFDKQRIQKNKVATEAHLSTLCELLWGDKIPKLNGGVSDLFALGIIASMFGGGGGLGTIAPLPKINEKEPESTQNTDKGV